MNDFQLPKNRNLPSWFTKIIDDLKELAVASKDRIQARDSVPIVEALFLDKRIQKMEDLKDLFLFLLGEVEKKFNKRPLKAWEKVYGRSLLNFMKTTMLIAVDEFDDTEQVKLNCMLEEIKKISPLGYSILIEIKNDLFTAWQALLRYSDEMEIKGIKRTKDKALIALKAQRIAIEKEIPLNETIQTEIKNHIKSKGGSARDNIEG